MATTPLAALGRGPTVKRKQVVLALLPGRIDVAVYDGSRRLESKRLTIDAEQDDVGWAKTLRRSAVSLREIIVDEDLVGAPTTVLYRSPTQSVDAPGFAVRSEAEAAEAALMKCMDALPYSALSAISEAVVIGRDAGGEAAETHVVVAAEREDVAKAIVDLVEEAGLSFRSATPLDAATIAFLVRGELQRKGARRGALYVGEYMSFFVVVSEGRLLFSRRIDLGLESLAGSLTGPVSVAGQAGSIELDIDEARRVLYRHGIPTREASVLASRGLTGRHVIPLLQPVLQRYIVELRQSLRFGLSEEDREGLTIHLTGPGAAIGRLAEVLGEELRIETSVDGSYFGAGPWWEVGPRAGEVADALKDHRFLGRLNLMPKMLQREQTTSRTRRWMIAGAATALVLIAVDGLRYRTYVNAARLESDVYAAQMRDFEALRTTGEQLAAVLGAQHTVETAIVAEVGSLVNYRACLQELARVTPPAVRFTTIEFDRNRDPKIGKVTGYAFEDAGDAERTVLEPFIEALQESPLFDAVELGNIEIGAPGNRAGQRFQATFRIVSVPRDGVFGDATALAAEGAPE